MGHENIEGMGSVSPCPQRHGTRQKESGFGPSLKGGLIVEDESMDAVGHVIPVWQQELTYIAWLSILMTQLAAFGLFLAAKVGYLQFVFDLVMRPDQGIIAAQANGLLRWGLLLINIPLSAALFSSTAPSPLSSSPYSAQILLREAFATVHSNVGESLTRRRMQ
jgi:hypothetical protein